MSFDPSDYPRHGENVIECVQCGGSAGKFYPAKTYGDPDNCSPAEDTVEFWEGDNAFCSEECIEEWHAEHDDPEEDED